ncbi:MAG: DUF6463 family protein [Erythrobacter sp.]|jgi:hypothetical protein|nr:DUF6463 family protein [Erythrobacter sp.]
MLRLAGPVLIVFSLVHAGMTFVLFPEAIAVIVDAGLFGGTRWAFSDMETLAAFWFLAFSWPAFALGLAVDAAHRRMSTVPGARSVGAVLLASIVVSGLVLPVSGLWAFAIPALMLIFGRTGRAVS